MPGDGWHRHAGSHPVTPLAEAPRPGSQKSARIGARAGRSGRATVAWLQLSIYARGAWARGVLEFGKSGGAEAGGDEEAAATSEMGDRSQEDEEASWARHAWGQGGKARRRRPSQRNGRADKVERERLRDVTNNSSLPYPRPRHTAPGPNCCRSPAPLRDFKDGRRAARGLDCVALSPGRGPGPAAVGRRRGGWGERPRETRRSGKPSKGPHVHTCHGRWLAKLTLVESRLGHWSVLCTVRSKLDERSGDAIDVHRLENFKHNSSSDSEK